MQLHEELNPYAPPDPQLDARRSIEEKPGIQVLAGRGARLGAAVLDGLLYLACFVPAWLATIALLSSRVMHDFYFALFVPLGIGMVAMLLLAALQWYLVATTGQSLGKRWLDLKIVKMDGSNVDFVTGVVMRSWLLGVVFVVPYLGLCAWLLDALWIFGEEHRCVHDHIAGTKVIMKSVVG
jgi:uncharacterized RDD family membrane protein YckC